MTQSNSKPTYFNITIHVDDTQKQELSDHLLTLGALAVSDLGIPNELVLLSTDPNFLSNSFPHLSCVQVDDWEYKWMEHFTGHFLTPNTYILPETQPMPENLSAQRIITLNPRDAFGDGNHPTTQLCAEALETIAPHHVSKKTFLDLGTGTGVLAILAKQLGFQHVEATDIDPSSVYKAQKNLALNQCNDIIVSQSDVLKNPPTTPYDVIVANLLTHILLDSLEALKQCLKPHSHLILSGIGSKWKKEFDTAITNAKLTLISHSEKEGWLCYILCRTTQD